MSDEQTLEQTESTGENTGAADQQQPDIAQIVAEQVAAQLAGIKDSLYSMVRKTAQDAARKTVTRTEPKPQPEPEPQPNAEIVAMRAELESIRSERAIADALAARPDINPKRQSELKRLARADRPEDIGKWLAEVEPAPQQTPPGGPAPRTATRTGETSSNVLEWSRDDYERDFMRNAPNPADPYDIANRPYYKKIRQQAEAQLRKVKIDLRGDGSKK